MRVCRKLAPVTAIAVAAAAGGLLVAYLWHSLRDAQQRVDIERSLRLRAESLRAEDRAGRIRAEKQLRSSRRAEPTGDAPTRMRPIGHLTSCFKTRNGTPRQPGIVPAARSFLRLADHLRIDGTDAFDGLAAYSHVWLIFEFHGNTNLHGAPLKAKVRPPRVDARVGLFATRTPHRPNAIGLSLVELESVRGGVLWFAGADLLDGTPILDIKPYCPSTDCAAGPVRVADWVTPRQVVDFESVDMSDDARAALRALEPTFELYDTAEELEELISQVLAHEIRSIHRREIDATEHSVRLDTILVRYEIQGERVRVTRIERAAAAAQQE